MGVGYYVAPETSEQNAVDKIAKFLVRYIGWSVAQDVTDTATDRDIVLSSPGELYVNNPKTRYIRLRGNADTIILSTYETFTSTVSNTGLLSEATYGHVNCIGTVRVTCVADLERVVIHIEEDGGSRFFGYVGRIDAYTEWPQHNYPNLIKGMNQVIYDFFYTAVDSNMFMRRSDGTVSPYFSASVVSSSTVNAGGVSMRTGAPAAFKIPVFYDRSSTFKEVPGELRGVYWVPEELFDHGDFIKIDGQIYTIIKGLDNNGAWAIGPVSRDRKVPPRLPEGVDLVTNL